MIQKVFRKVEFTIPLRGLRTIGPEQFYDRPARGGFKTSAIEEAEAHRQCCSCSSSSLTKAERMGLAFVAFLTIYIRMK